MDITALGDSIQMATNRFYSLEQRLMKKPELQKMYIDFMREYESLGHMARADQGTLVQPYYVIPHHCVLKLDSTTTKLRVVFDASAKTSSGVSLNDITHVGPVVQSELTSILLRFRTHRFVFTTDVEKMYRQIRIHEDDQRFQYILWREHPSHKLEIFKLLTVTYGTRSAPYLATKCLQRLARENKDLLPMGSMVLNNDFYVDDGLSGSDSLTEALEIKRQLIRITSSAGLNLRKWCANHAQLLEGIPPQDQEVNLDLNDESSRGTIKTLGLIWTPKTDELCIRSTTEFHKTITKRTVTSEMARIYDPLGLIAPVIVKAKIFIQMLWQQKLDWDVKLPDQQHRQWSRFQQELKMLDSLRIPRHVFRHRPIKCIELHVFADASEKAYGAAVYIRAEHKDSTITVQLLCSKSRVAPLKTQTIPRLELCAALLGAELVTKVKQDLHYQEVETHMWTDSEIVLHWINAQSTAFQTFVAHRIAKIRQLTATEQWRHVGTKDNPADVLSRGISPTDIKTCTPWFWGPLFLYGVKASWPPVFHRELALCPELEIKKPTIVLTTSLKEGLVTMIYSIDHKGSITYLQRIVAYILRFTRSAKFGKGNASIMPHLLTATELKDAMMIIIRAIQQGEFANEINQLQKEGHLKSNHAQVSLTPFIDSSGMLRVGGRLQRSDLSFDARHSLFFPLNDPLVKLIMTQLHYTNMQCGPQALSAQTRQKFWPRKGKRMARSIVQHCVRCTRAKPKVFNQVVGNLPLDRLQRLRRFLNTGVDFCGPV